MKDKINDYINKAENYIRSHPDRTGTTNAMIALTLSIQQIETIAKQLNKNINKFNETSSDLSTKLVLWTKILAIATMVLAIATVSLWFK